MKIDWSSMTIGDFNSELKRCKEEIDVLKSKIKEVQIEAKKFRTARSRLTYRLKRKLQ